MKTSMDRSLITPEMLVDKGLWTRKGKYTSQNELFQAYIEQQVKTYSEEYADPEKNIDLVEQEIYGLLNNPVLKTSLHDKQYQDIILELLKKSILAGLITPNRENSILERFMSGVVLDFIIKQERESLDFSKALIMLVNSAHSPSSVSDMEKKWLDLTSGVYKGEFSDFI